MMINEALIQTKKLDYLNTFFTEFNNNFNNENQNIIAEKRDEFITIFNSLNSAVQEDYSFILIDIITFFSNLYYDFVINERRQSETVRNIISSELSELDIFNYFKFNNSEQFIKDIIFTYSLFPTFSFEQKCHYETLFWNQLNNISPDFKKLLFIRLFLSYYQDILLSINYNDIKNNNQQIQILIQHCDALRESNEILSEKLEKFKDQRGIEQIS